jgi:hypothetical protein
MKLQLMSPMQKKPVQLIIILIFLLIISPACYPSDTYYEVVVEQSQDWQQKSDDQSGGIDPPSAGEAGSSNMGGSQGYLEDEVPAAGSGLEGYTISSPGNTTLKPVGFVNYGSINATVRAWTYVPLGEAEPRPAPVASTVSDAQTTGGDWPNSSRFLSVPMGTYTWCIEWEEGDQDEDGYFDYFHYLTVEPTVLDENDSDELEFAEEVSISPPPDSAPIYEGKCYEHPIDVSCAGKTTEVHTFVRHITFAPAYPIDVQALADTGQREAPEGVTISASGGALPYHGSMVLLSPGDWIEATTSDPYSAMGVQIFGDMTIGWARVLFDEIPVWEGDTSTCVIDPAENNGLGWYGIYVEVRCFPPGEHTLRVESTKTKTGVGGWEGGVPVNLFGFRE